MKRRWTWIGAILALAGAAAGTWLVIGDPRELLSQQGSAPKVSLTIYSHNSGGAPSLDMAMSGYAVVREIRSASVRKGRSEVRFTDVARLIDPTSVKFESLTDAARTHVVEQTYEYDLVSSDKLMERYIDKSLTVGTEQGKVEGKLMSFDSASLVLNTGDSARPIQILSRGDHVQSIAFSAMPENLITKPTLVWKVDAEREGEHQVKVSYQTGGMSWTTNYLVVLNDAETQAQISAWATLANMSGTRYESAQIKLIAGDVQRVQSLKYDMAETVPVMAMRNGGADGDGFEEKPFFEYHLYTLARPVTLNDNSIKQIELFPPAPAVKVQKTLVYSGFAWQPWFGRQVIYDRSYDSGSPGKVDVFIEFENRKEHGMGLPLPRGLVRVYKEDPADGSMEFVGEDAIDHTPKDEKILLRMGSSFDVTAERKQTNFQSDARNIHETTEITLKNHKKEPVTVVVREFLFRWRNWEILKPSVPFVKKDAHTIQFTVTLPADGRATVTYTAHYSDFPVGRAAN